MEGMMALAEEQATNTETLPESPVEVAKDEPVEITDEAADAPADTETAEEATDEAAANDEEQANEDGETPEEVFEEVEYEGKRYSLPPELKAALLRQADYTRKTQEVADMKRAAEAKAADIENAFNVSQEYVQAKAYEHALNEQLQQYQGLTQADWSKLESEDPIAAQGHWRQFQMLEKEALKVKEFIQKTESDRGAAEEQAIANRLRETREFAEREIPGWNDEVDRQVFDFATSQGFDAATLRKAYNPQTYRVLYYAMIGAKSLQRQQAPQKAAQIPVKPLSKVTAKASPAAAKDPEDMSMAEYVAYRNAQMKR